MATADMLLPRVGVEKLANRFLLVLIGAFRKSMCVGLDSPKHRLIATLGLAHTDLYWRSLLACRQDGRHGVRERR
jgi:hypothetical protein